MPDQSGCRFRAVPFVLSDEHVRLDRRSDAMKPNSISGVSYAVQDLARTAQFYESIGFRPGKAEGDRATFYVNWFFVTFIEEPEADAARGSGVLLHMKVDDLEETRGALVALGVTPEERGKNELLVRDPDGYQLVFFYKK
jgi:catechol 2,3-dioxygenase-like lactoylglutathione lyase family enzyme